MRVLSRRAWLYGIITNISSTTSSGLYSPLLQAQLSSPHLITLSPSDSHLSAPVPLRLIPFSRNLHSLSRRSSSFVLTSFILISSGLTFFGTTTSFGVSTFFSCFYFCLFFSSVSMCVPCLHAYTCSALTLLYAHIFRANFFLRASCSWLFHTHIYSALILFRAPSFWSTPFRAHPVLRAPCLRLFGTYIHFILMSLSCSEPISFRKSFRAHIFRVQVYHTQVFAYLSGVGAYYFANLFPTYVFLTQIFFKEFTSSVFRPSMSTFSSACTSGPYLEGLLDTTSEFASPCSLYLSESFIL